MFVRKQVKQKSDDVAKAYNAALRYLTRREYSKVELYNKLKLYYTDSASKEALKKCLEYHYQSDERYAQALSHHLISQGYGPRKLMVEACKKGLNKSYYQEVLDDTDWVQIAALYLKKKLKGTDEITFEQKQKILASLARRGFSNSQCLEAFDRYQELVDEE
ncbi:MAG: regulatory protein RecX [Succinivibrio sp.]|nr:regulatory protein RecX [Succinivibrio sp.]